eukprot:m.688311 g.688311  ORF g.688311 m.688311 type:complete len:433 (-) comp58633_c0_seq3:2381-3679(-)
MHAHPLVRDLRSSEPVALVSRIRVHHQLSEFPDSLPGQLACVTLHLSPLGRAEEVNASHHDHRRQGRSGEDDWPGEPKLGVREHHVDHPVHAVVIVALSKDIHKAAFQKQESNVGDDRDCHPSPTQPHPVERVNADLERNRQQANSVHEGPEVPQILVVRARRTIGKQRIGQEEDDGALPQTNGDERKEALVGHARVVEQGAVKSRMLQQFVLVKILLKDAVEQGRQRCEDDTPQRHQPGVKESLAREERPQAEEEDGEDEVHVLVEHVVDGVRDAQVRVAAVQQKQAREKLELAEGVIAGSHCLATFLAINPNADMGLADHGNVIRSVSNRKRDWYALLGLACDDRFGTLLDEFDHKCLLNRRKAATKHGNAPRRDLIEQRLKLVLFRKRVCQRSTINDQHVLEIWLAVRAPAITAPKIGTAVLANIITDY